MSLKDEILKQKLKRIDDIIEWIEFELMEERKANALGWVEKLKKELNNIEL